MIVATPKKIKSVYKSPSLPFNRRRGDLNAADDRELQPRQERHGSLSRWRVVRITPGHTIHLAVVINVGTWDRPCEVRRMVRIPSALITAPMLGPIREAFWRDVRAGRTVLRHSIFTSADRERIERCGVFYRAIGPLVSRQTGIDVFVCLGWKVCLQFDLERAIAATEAMEGCRS